MVVRSLFAGLVDDAAVFPPGNAPMDRALVEHAQLKDSACADLVGSFLCPTSRIDELLAALPGDQHLRLALVVDAAGDTAHHALRAAATDPRLTLAGVEAAHDRLGPETATVGGNLARLPGVAGYLEVARGAVQDGLDAVAESGWHAAKFRTGGTAAEAYPTEAELATFLVATAARAIPFKLTAGLHRAVRSTSPEGFETHGVLNVLVATRVAGQGGSTDAVTAVLADRDPEPLVQFVRAWDEDACTDVRRAFVSFGCCGVADPIDDLTDLGLLGDLG